ncbi:MAG: hypothetical protein C4334_12885 [Pyrinomonas sp.]|uniref:hypothetical protein n=1 Tax=Pyrinomonas sp. TaxID=2080306 RepID=UPI0033183E9A
MMMTNGFLAAFFFLLALSAQGQQPPVKQNARSADGVAAAAVRGPSAVEAARFTYEFSQPEFYVRRITIEHDAAGRGTLIFERKDVDGPISEELKISPATLERLRSLWASLRYLETRASYQSEKQFPHLGTVRLRVRRGDGAEKTTEFNWTNDKDAFALANEYRRLADQTILMFDLMVARDNQPLATPKLMETLETMIARDGLADPQQLVPLLKELSSDERLPLMARNKAAKLLKKLEK